MKSQEVRWVQRANSFGRASTYFAEFGGLFVEMIKQIERVGVVLHKK